MSIARHDSWNQDEDVLLAEVVLRHIRDGSTQLKAFEEVGRELSRTPSACGFRWNSFLRKRYKSRIELSKKQRKENKIKPYRGIDKALSTFSKDEIKENRYKLQNVSDSASSITMQEVLLFLTKMDMSSRLWSKEKEQLSQSYQIILEQNNTLREDNNRLQNKLNEVEADYRALLQVMERARKLVVLEEKERV
ncbi:RsfA family transcriptional regulator [Bacillus sp. JJ634]